MLLALEDLVVSFASSATFSTISFLFKESIGSQESFNSWFTTFFKESMLMSFLFLTSLLMLSRLDSCFLLPFFNSLNFSKFLLSPRIKKKRIETVK